MTSRDADASPAESTRTTAASDEKDPTQLASKVDELVSLTQQYNQLAGKVRTHEDYQQHAAELKELNDRINPLIIAIMRAERTMTVEEVAEFDRQHFASRAKPMLDEKRAHEQRFEGLSQ